MRAALVVVAHPRPDSFTHAVANEIVKQISQFDTDNLVEIVDLAAEGFDPRFSEADLRLFKKEDGPPTDVAAEQLRLERMDNLVLVYPVYWWSFPALLKGWIDRVFTQGWAYEEDASGHLVKKLQWLRVHLVAIGAAHQQTYSRHGYSDAMNIQINHGIFGYCGAHVAISELLLTSDAGFPDSQLERARVIGQNIAVSGCETVSVKESVS